VRQAAAAVTAIVDDTPLSYELAWHRITHNYRMITRSIVLATTPPGNRHAIVPACTLLPGVFKKVVNALAR
jgi:hypothetical protein